jgi:hypothetical protein
MATPTLTIEGALVALLTADAGVAAIVAARIYPFNAPATMPTPKLTHWRWGTDRDADVGGFSNDGPSGFAVAKVFVDCWADDALTVKNLAAAVRRAVNGYAGNAAGAWSGKLLIRVADEREQAATLIPGRAVPVQRQTLDLRISYGDN